MTPSPIAPEPLHIHVVTGPTASGKSEMVLRLAERMDAEIISMDSMKVYRGMDIGTAKPDAAARERVQHHLLDIRDPWETYTVHEFVKDAEALAREIVGRGRAVMFEGGTPLYLKAFLDGLFEGPQPDPDLRARLEREADELGLSHLHGRMAAIDPAAGKRIHPNDKRRIVRALEVYEQTGTPISELQKQFGKQRAHIDAKLVAIERPRPEMADRIARRIGLMLASGWIDEAAALMNLPHPVSKPASGALGYRELWSHLRGELTLDDARTRIVSETWRFMRSQLTWLRSFGDLVWVEGTDDPEADAASVQALWAE